MLQGQVIKLTVPLAGDCNLTLNSAPGTTPTWTVNVPLNFVFDPTFGDRRIAVGDLSVSGVEATDYTLSGNFACQLGSFLSPSGVADTYEQILSDYIGQVGNPLCADPGPGYLGGPCQQVGD
jgi:hypothetical protein